MRRACPYRGENPGPGKDVHGELDPRPGIREQPGFMGCPLGGARRVSAVPSAPDIAAWDNSPARGAYLKTFGYFARASPINGLRFG
jgi:hypothetical protein